MKRLAIPCSLLLCLAASAAAAGEVDESEYMRNWPHWRGPLANGIAPEADPPVTWSQDSNIRWKVELPGEGTASPIVWNDRIYILTAIETDRKGEVANKPQEETEEADAKPTAGDAASGRRPRRSPGRGPFNITPPENYYQFVVMCLDRATGKIIWQEIAREEVPHEGHHPDNGYASGSPTTDGKYLYASFGSRGTYCYDMNGNKIWERDLGDMRTRFSFGEASTPVLHDGSLIVMWDQEDDSFIYVLDAKTGKTRWERPRDEPSNWSTPLIVEHGGRTQIVTNGTTRVRSYDFDTGALVWECGGQTTNAIPAPVTTGGLVFCMSGLRGNAIYAIPLDAEGDISDTDRIAWHRDQGAPYVPSPLVYGDRLFFTASNRNILSCLEAATGEPIIDRERLDDVRAFYASPVAAADRIYLIDREGTALVLKNATKLEVLATNRLDEPTDATPALVDNQIIIRSEKHLYCIEEM